MYIKHIHFNKYNIFSNETILLIITMYFLEVEKHFSKSTVDMGLGYRKMFSRLLSMHLNFLRSFKFESIFSRGTT